MSFAPAKNLFPPRINSLQEAATWFSVLGDETRLKIIDCLSENELYVYDLIDVLESKQLLFSFHLKAPQGCRYSQRPAGRTLVVLLAQPERSRLPGAVSQDTAGTRPQSVYGAQNMGRKCCEGDPFFACIHQDLLI